MINSILVPFDDSPPSRRALEYAVSVFPGRSVTLLRVIDLSSRYRYGAEFDFTLPQDDHLEYRRERVSHRLEEAIDSIDGVDGELTAVVEVGHPPTVISEFASEASVDQIVMGSHGRSGVSRMLFGSVAESVLRRCDIPVVVVP